jgi:hypothetical protein
MNYGVPAGEAYQKALQLASREIKKKVMRNSACCFSLEKKNSN